MEFMLNNLSMI